MAKQEDHPGLPARENRCDFPTLGFAVLPSCHWQYIHTGDSVSNLNSAIHVTRISGYKHQIGVDRMRGAQLHGDKHMHGSEIVKHDRLTCGFCE
jgi:hypothetical protein